MFVSCSCGPVKKSSSEGRFVIPRDNEEEKQEILLGMKRHNSLTACGKRRKKKK